MTPADLERFRKIAGLLGSEHSGERAAAALKCTEFLASHGLTWADVTVATPGAAPGRPWEAGEAEMARRRAEVVREAYAAKEGMRKRNRERWAQNAQQPDANGFYDDLREDIRRATGGEDGVRDPRVRK